ncbi:MAG: hypothetical protein FJ214_11085 [Ignavibacteria bacterium]|nr:hypothetical protein [Ignavibacteria bacterium]
MYSLSKFKILVFFFLIISNLVAQPNLNQKIGLIIGLPTQPIKNFKGFGAEWDSRSYELNGVTSQDFKLIGDRIKWMKVPIVRTMMQTKWCFSQSLGFDWESNDMKLLYRHLDFCQKNGIEVMLSDWGVEVDWLAVDGIKSTSDSLYADVIGKYLNHLVNTKGYSCIKYFGLVNEPNYEVGNFERWKLGMENLFQVFVNYELNKKIKLVGPGTSNNKQWFFDTVDEIRYLIDVYDVHMYAWKDRTAIGSVQLELTELWDYAKSIDRKGDEKLYFVTEAGMRDGQSAEISTQIDSYYYGVFMIDYAIQAVHSGATTVLAWMMDDNSHPEFNWGLWTDKKNGMQLRPWFYSWSLLTKLFPAGSDVFKIRSRSINIRALGARINLNGKTNWSFCIVNLANNAQKVLLKVDNETNFKFAKYLYQEGNLVKDSNGYPKPIEFLSFNLNDGLEIEVPSKSVLFFTSQAN